MIGLFFLTLLAPPDWDHRDALTRYGSAVLKLCRNELVSAQKQFETAAKADPRAAAPRKALIRIYLDLGRDPAAERAARAVLELDPNDAETGLALGRMLLTEKKPKEAATVLAKAAASPRRAKDLATAIDVDLELARAAEQAGNLPDAESALNRRVDLLITKKTSVARSTGYSPEDVDHLTAETWERLGTVRIGLRNWDAAATAFQNASKLFADRNGANDSAAAARVHRNLARTFAAKEDFPAAVKEQAAYLAAKAPGLPPLVNYAEYLRRAGRDSVAELERLAEANPRSERLKWVLASERGKKNTAAADQAKTDLEKFAAGSTDPELYGLVADFISSTGRPGDALDWASTVFQAAKDDPNSSLKRKRMALVSDAILSNKTLAMGVVNEAAIELRRQKSRSEGTWEFVTWLGERIGQPDVAGDAALAAFRTNNRSPEVIQQAFRTLERRRQWDELIAICDLYLRSRGDGKQYFRAMVTRAHALAELNRGNEAMAALDSTQRIDWNNDGKFSLRVYRVVTLTELGQYRRAISEGETLLAEQTRPTDMAQVRYVLADAYLGAKQFDKAEAALRAVLEVDPDDIVALNNLGYHLAEQGQKLPEAEDLIRRAIALDRDKRARAGNPVIESGGYLDSLGWALFRQGKLTDAKRTFEAALSFPEGASDPLVWDHFGDVLFKLGDREKAKEAWKKAEPGYETGHQGRQDGRKEELERKLDLFR